ncbi:MAG: DNA polymerase III subunit beta [Clostridia bacterium]|nr:DNA polymerase III subunit beta [Clostridia bacterium]
MKIVFSKSRFLEKLTPAMGTVSNKNTIASIEGVLIETVEAGLRLSTYDMKKGTVSEMECLEVVTPGSVIINASRLSQILKVMPEDEVTLTVDDRFGATGTAGASTFSLFGLRGSDFPNLPVLMGERGFEIECGLLRRMIGKVIHSVGEAQESRPMLGGAFFRIMDGTFEIVSCDSFTLSICKKVCDIKDIGTVDSQAFEFIVPGHALNELLRILPEGEERMNVYLTRKHAIFRLDEITFFTRLIDEDYIEYERIIPRDQTVFVTVNRERLLEGLERAGLVAEDKSQSNGRSFVCIKIEDNLLTLTSTSVSGKVYDEMECIHEGEPIEIGFNCRYLINSIRVAEGEEIRLTLKSAKQSVTIEPMEPAEDSSYFYMVLPVRMGN